MFHGTLKPRRRVKHQQRSCLLSCDTMARFVGINWSTRRRNIVAVDSRVMMSRLRSFCLTVSLWAPFPL